MRLRDAVAMLAGCGLDAPGPTVWADLGSGAGTFTRALAEVLAPGSIIHALDLDPSALSHLPPRHHDVTIQPRRADFLDPAWPLPTLDGILMANSLHYVEDQPAFISLCLRRLKPPRRFLIVEYDLARPNRWVPNPIGRTRLEALFASPGPSSITFLGSRPSVYHRADLYAALVTAGSRGAAPPWRASPFRTG